MVCGTTILYHKRFLWLFESPEVINDSSLILLHCNVPAGCLLLPSTFKKMQKRTTLRVFADERKNSNNKNNI